ncbi:MAG: methyltransferase domain-containing protein [Magnetococcus sp. THC-1_WYH]
MGLGKRVFSKLKRFAASRMGSAAYWSVYSVAEKEFTSREESLNHFYWRSDQYLNYLNLMPVSGFDGQVVLDYGCGPGNDIIGFIEKSKPLRLIGADVSGRSLEMARKRVALHGGEVEFVKLDENNTVLPIASDSVDYIHSSGVLHHVYKLEPTLLELFRILRPGGQLRVMVYNYNSISFHLNTAYLERLKLPNFGAGRSLYDIFKATTDGKYCPISRVYKPDEFLGILRGAGFEGVYLGAAISISELKIFDRRFDAILDIRFEKEHRDFLLELTFDNKNIPLYKGNIAGLDACFLFTKK